MKPRPTLVLDPRRAGQLAAALGARRPGYLPGWEPPAGGVGAALVAVWARYLEALTERFQQAPEKHRLTFLELLGIELIPARAARAPVVFQLSESAPAVRLPAGSQVAAPPPPEGSEQIVFETERSLGLSPARLQEVVSLWPGRDQYVDHSAELAAGETLRPFERPQLADTPHALYLAHDVLLALSGQVRLEVEFELTQPGSEPLDLVWEYWDGELWRGFKHQHPKLDGTAGLTRSGRFILEAECAESATTEVDGVEASWIRGRLDEPLPADPEQILPEVARLRLSNVTEHGIGLRQVAEEYRRPEDDEKGPAITVVVNDLNGLPLSGAEVTLDDLVTSWTNREGRATFYETIFQDGKPHTLEVFLFDSAFVRQVTFEPSEAFRNLLEVTLTVDSGLPLDAAFADAEELDPSKPFFPFGQQPRPGSTFYFSSEEVFSKPGARVTAVAMKTDTPQEHVRGSGGEDLANEIAWEYWNGREWFPLGVVEEEPEDASYATFSFEVPKDLAAVEVHGQDGLWMRARLVSGGFGFVRTVLWRDPDQPDDEPSNELTYVVAQPPAVGDFRLTYTWEHGPLHPERVLAYNDFRYRDHSDAAKWPDLPFPPFRQVADVTPTLYLGFDGPPPVDRLNLYFDLVEPEDAEERPALVWEYWPGDAWRALQVEDETRDLTYPGMVSYVGPRDSAALARFGRELHWLRVRLGEDAPPPEPVIRGIHPNAAWVSQWQTVANEGLGTSRGRKGETFTCRRIPVLAGERLEVCESAGARAGVEWRLLAREVLGDDPRTLRELEDELAREGMQTDVEWGDLRLRRDRHKRVSEVWVRWHPRPHLPDSGPGDRHYVLERARGVVAFGDGEHGKIPPLEAEIRLHEYRTGGGKAGNVAAGAISQALTGIAGLDGVSNPSPAEGGADGESLEALALRGPHSLVHRGRAVTPAHFETLAREASAAVAVARARPTCDAGGRHRPGWVTVVVLPHSDEGRPWPSFGLREEVRRFLAERAAAGMAHRILVTGPDYREVEVEATLAPRDPAAAGEVAKAAREALETFLHPLRGGPEGGGWEPGRDVYLSDVAATLERVEGVDYVRDLALFVAGRRQGERARVPAGETVVAGDVRLKLITEEA